MKRIYLYIILLFSVLAMMYFLRPRQVILRDYPEISAENVMRVVTEYNQIGCYVSGDTIEGFQYELCRAISDMSGLEVQIFLEMSLAESFKGLESGKYDVIARNIPITTEIREKYLFIDPIILDKQVLVQRKAEFNDSIAPIRNQLELAGKTLYVPANSSAMLRLQNLQHEIGDTIYIVEEKLYSAEQLIIMVAKGDIDYAVCELRASETAKKQLPEIDIATDIGFTQLQSWVLRRQSPALSDSLDKWFDYMRDTGVYDDIFERYYTKNR